MVLPFLLPFLRYKPLPTRTDGLLSFRPVCRKLGIMTELPNKTAPKQKKPLSWGGCMVILMVPMLLFAVLSMLAPRTKVDASPSASARSAQVPASVERQLASIDAGHIVTTDTASVKRFRYLLSELTDRFGVSATRIADVTVTARGQLADKYGRQVDLEFLMEHALDISASAGPNETYEGIMALMVVTLGNS